ncbi:DNA polymerase epsilon subunit B [Neolecta irregularis DAH-3]|uniref:DNA polymerase epsilon subunit B n=1 Tax=Neolecta irregularis (strain DAH-3) TaxID=1198029 RepID=A0A1U7LQX5_NEOID|nr:DNA polymerase epsilon subunit B [Neolecta irregularis DAH-3]|eukprot:OLL25076.1 DNA polymerase epsilon subunit B [Neolecta irregularis DAH-3]
MTAIAPIFGTKRKRNGSNVIPKVLPVQLLPAQLRPIAFRIFTKKHNLTLKSDALKLLAEWVGQRCGVEWRTTAEPRLDEIARIWGKREESNPLVSEDKLVPILRDIDVPHTIKSVSTKNKKDDVESLDIPQSKAVDIDPAKYLVVIDAFNQPKWVFNPHRKTFEKSLEPPCIVAAAASHKPGFFRERYFVLKQRLLRNEAFQAPSFSGSQISQGKDYHKITSIKNLLGRAGQSFMLFGMLAIAPQGHLYLEDVDDTVKLDMSEAARVSGDGWFAPGCFVLVDGTFASDGRFRVLTLGHPPVERRQLSKEIYGHIDFLGLQHGERETEKYLRRAEHHFENAKIVVASDVKLDDAKTMNALKNMFEHYNGTTIECPLAFILCGNFMSNLFHTNGFSAQYKERWNALATLIDSFPHLARGCKWVFIPGPNDPWTSSLYLPRKEIPSVFINRVRRVCKDCVFASNPCRISYFTQDIVIFRDDVLSRLRRNSMVFKPAVKEQEQGDDSYRPPPDQDDIPDDVKAARNVLVRTILDQGHLSPFHVSIKPVLWDFDYTLRLFPLPTALIVADADCPSFEITYGGCHTINPSSLSFGSNRAGWVEYFPARTKGQRVDKSI